MTEQYNMGKTLNYAGFLLIILATALGVLYNIDCTNNYIGNLFYSSGRNAILHLSNLDATHDHRTLDKDIEKQKKSYELLIAILKRNRPEINYTTARAIESKAIAKYAPAIGDQQIIQLISPPISLLTGKAGSDAVVTNLDTLKIWYRNSESSSFFTWVLVFFLVGNVAQFLGKYDFKTNKSILMSINNKRWLLLLACLIIVIARAVWPTLKIDDVSMWFLLFAALLFAMPELKGWIKKIKVGDAEVELKDTMAERPDLIKDITHETTVEGKEEDDKTFHVYVAAGMQYERVHRYDLAIYSYEKALNMKSQDIGLHLRLAVIYGEMLGDRDNKLKAINHCKAAVSIEKNNISANFNLAVYTNHLEGGEKSLPIYQRCESLIREQGLTGTELDGKLHLFLGHDYRSLGNSLMAKQCYEKAATILSRLAETGDKTSQFWLNDVKKHLSAIK